jgi:hypothetical protein
MFYPPRPEKAVDPSELGRFESLGWIGQFKKNGTYTVPDREKVYTRHLEPHKLWNPNDSKAMTEIRKIPGITLCSELLHKKVSGGSQDTLYIHDILVINNEDLVGVSYEDRYKMLLNLFVWKDEGNPDYFVVNKNLWISKWIYKGFLKTFNAMTNPEDEGLVLKNPKAKLAFCGKPGSNSSWQIKCRRPHKNYSF